MYRGLSVTLFRSKRRKEYVEIEAIFLYGHRKFALIFFDYAGYAFRTEAVVEAVAFGRLRQAVHEYGRLAAIVVHVYIYKAVAFSDGDADKAFILVLADLFLYGVIECVSEKNGYIGSGHKRYFLAVDEIAQGNIVLFANKAFFGDDYV